MDNIFDLFIDNSAAASYSIFKNTGCKDKNGCDRVLFHLMSGPIKNGIGSKERKQWFLKNSFLDDNNKISFIDFESKQNLKLKKILESHKNIRFWVSTNSVYEVSVFYYICSLIENHNGKYFIVKSEDGDFPYSGFGELEREDFYSYSKLYKELTREEISAYSAEWKKLCEENGECRELIDGKLCTQFPDSRDGLTTYQRQLLYTMKELHLIKSGQTKKNALIVGQTMRYLSIGDEQIYRTLCNLSKKYYMNVPLLIFQGNNGTRKNPQASIYRYTESKLSETGEKVLANIDKLSSTFKTIKRSKDEDEYKVPAFFTGDFPYLLINGNSEIAGHDENRVYEAIKAYSENPEISDSDLHKIIGNPKFADDRIILEENFEEYHKTGKGVIKYRYPENKNSCEMILQNRVLVDGEMKILNLRDMLKAYVEHNRFIKKIVYNYDLGELQHKHHLLSAMKLLHENYVDIINIIYQEAEKDEIVSKLIQDYNIDEKQCNVILDSQMKRLMGESRESLISDIEEIEKSITEIKNKITLL